MKPLYNSWNEEREKRLVELCRRKHWTSTDVTKTLNLEFPTMDTLTRNAVLGKLKRINDRDAAHKRKKLRPHTRLNPKNPKNSSAKMDQFDKTPIKGICCVEQHIPTKPKILPAQGHRNVKPEDLRVGMCRWPAGDPNDRDFSYCGAPTAAPRGSYCAAHDQIARPLKPRGGRT